MEKESRGLLFLLLAEFFWGISSTFAKFIYGATSKIDPFVLIQLRLTLAATILVIIFYFKDRELLRINKSDLPYLIKYGCCVAFMQVTLYYAISKTNVGIAVFLQSFSAVLVSLYCIVIGREKVGTFRLLALGVGFLGLFVMLYNQFFVLPSVNMWGVIGGLASAVGVSVYLIYGKYGLSKYKPQTMLVYAYIFGALLSWFFVPPWVVVNKGFTIAEWGYCFFIAIFAAVIPYYFNLKGLELSTTSTAGIVTILNPVIAAITAFLILGEILTSMQIMGVILITLSIVFLQMEVQQDIKKELLLKKI